MMKKSFVILTSVILLSACTTSPTGRKQLQLFSPQQMNQMGSSAYQDIKRKTPQIRSGKQYNYVQCVARQITQTVAPNTSWEVTLFNSKQANAFALPGGKIGIYTGLLKVATNQHQLATVVGHEIAHVLAKHANERISTAYVTQSGLQVAETISGANTATKRHLLGLLGVGAQVGILLPYGRSQESEADIMGLELMAKAGFNPRESVQLWRNMAKQNAQQPPEFLSTHPSKANRIAQLQQHMPKALALSQQQSHKPKCRL